MIIKSKDLIIRPTIYATKKEIDTDMHRHHIATNSILYKFGDNTTLPMFMKTLENVPDHISGEIFHRVLSSEIGRLDNISYLYYKTPELFWVIGILNNVDPLEMYEGQILRILPKDYVEYNILRYNIV